MRPETRRFGLRLIAVIAAFQVLIVPWRWRYYIPEAGRNVWSYGYRPIWNPPSVGLPTIAMDDLLFTLAVTGLVGLLWHWLSRRAHTDGG